MAKNSKIEWTHHTFNPWWGCTKVSAACKHCYAEAWARRVGSKVWGARAPRRFFGEAHWQEPRRWNQEAAREGERHRVFCASMADVFEDRAELDPWRTNLWELIADTPWLDWLLLTKRPHLVSRFVPWGPIWPSNVWLGTTAENQKWADQRIPHLFELPAAVRFLSCEPLLGRIDLTRWLVRRSSVAKSYPIDWVIVGGESGHRARPPHPTWIRHLRDQCTNAGVAFHFKQWGNWRPTVNGFAVKYRALDIEDGSGIVAVMVNMGKAAAGRELDGRTWDEIPASRSSRTTKDDRTITAF